MPKWGKKGDFSIRENAVYYNREVAYHDSQSNAVLKIYSLISGQIVIDCSWVSNELFNECKKLPGFTYSHISDNSDIKHVGVKASSKDNVLRVCLENINKHYSLNEIIDEIYQYISCIQPTSRWKKKGDFSIRENAIYSDREVAYHDSQSNAVLKIYSLISGQIVIDCSWISNELFNECKKLPGFTYSHISDNSDIKHVGVKASSKDSVLRICLENINKYYSLEEIINEIYYYCGIKSIDESYLETGDLTILSNLVNKDAKLAKKLFLQRESNIQKKDEAGNTFLQCAIIHDLDNLVTFFLQLKIDINSINQQDRSALEMVATKGKKDIAVLLIEKGADIRYSSFLENSSFPEKLAKSNGHHEEACGIRNAISERRINEYWRQQEKETERYIEISEAAYKLSSQK